MHKTEPPSRLMKETKTFHKSRQFLPRTISPKDVVVCYHYVKFTVTSTLGTNKQQCANIPNWWLFIMLPDPKWTFCFQIYSGHTAKNQMQTRLFTYTQDWVSSLQSSLCTNHSLLISLTDHTETIEMLIRIFSMAFKRFWESSFIPHSYFHKLYF